MESFYSFLSLTITMIEIDGSEKGGSGTILRQSIALAAVLGEEIHIYNVRS